MDRFIFDEEHEMFRDSVRSFMKNEIKPHSDRWHEAGIVDREAYLKAGEMGFLLMRRIAKIAKTRLKVRNVQYLDIYH